MNLRAAEGIFNTHRDAFMTLCRYLGWDEGMEEDDAVAGDLVAAAGEAEGSEDIPPAPPSSEEVHSEEED